MGNFTIFGVVLWVALAVVIGLLANELGRGFWVWTALSLLLSPLVFVLLLLFPDRAAKRAAEAKRATPRRCPHCPELVLPQARICPHCRTELPPNWSLKRTSASRPQSVPPWPAPQPRPPSR
jgi:hypothetical protein